MISTHGKLSRDAAIVDINNGVLSHTATTAAATLLTVPAGQAWEGLIAIALAISKAATATGNGSIRVLIATAGTGVTPAAGTQISAEAKAGANAATGTVGTQGHTSLVCRLVVVAPAGNSVRVTLQTDIESATEARADVSAIGENF